MARPRKDPSGQGAAIPGLPAWMVKSIDAASAKTAQIHEIMRRAVVGLVVQPGRIVIEMLIFDRTDWLRTLLRAAVMQRYPENPIKDIPNLGTAILKTDLKSVFDDQLMWDALEMTGVRKGSAEDAAV